MLYKYKQCPFENMVYQTTESAVPPHNITSRWWERPKCVGSYCAAFMSFNDGKGKCARLPVNNDYMICAEEK